MLSLTYLSSATELMSEPDLVALMETVRPKNAALGLTGLLLYSDGNIIQVLEGPDDAVRSTFASIAADRRHRGLIVVLEEEVADRAFPDWAMGFRNVADPDDLDGYSDYLRNPAGTPTGSGLAAQILETFRATTR